MEKLEQPLGKEAPELHPEEKDIQQKKGLMSEKKNELREKFKSLNMSIEELKKELDKLGGGEFLDIMYNDAESINKIILESTKPGELSEENESLAEEWLDKAYSFGKEGYDAQTARIVFGRVLEMEDRLKELRAQRERKKLYEQGQLMEHEIGLTKKEKAKQILSGIWDGAKGVAKTPLTLMTFGLGLAYQEESFRKSFHKIRDALENKKYKKYGYDYAKYYPLKGSSSY